MVHGAWVLMGVMAVGAAGGAIPGPGDPLRRVDLRWLARPVAGEWFLVDTFSSPGPERKDQRRFVLADVSGPGVAQHLMIAPAGQLWIEVDGTCVWQGEPAKQWARTYPSPKPDRRGTPPIAYPLAQTAWGMGHLAAPIPFRRRLVIRSDRGGRPMWLAGRRLAQPPELRLSDPSYRRRSAAAHERLNGRIEQMYALPGDRVVAVEAFCAPAQRTRLVRLEGSGEVTGLRLDVIPAACHLMRSLVVEATPDGRTTPTLRMPLVDLLGVSHPWSHAWFPMAGDQVAGLLHPYSRNRLGRSRDIIVAFFRLPMPFARGLHIDIVNRSPDLPMTLRGDIRVAALSADEADRAGRLCGTSRCVDLPHPKGTADLIALPVSGHLVGLSMFTTGHQTLYHGDHGWRRGFRIELTRADGTRIAAGPGLLPLAQWTNSPMSFALVWNQNSVFPRGMLGAARHFWVDPVPVVAGSRVRYTAGGPNGPQRAEVGALWYQMPGARGEKPYEAPAQPATVEPVPGIRFGLPRAEEPGGWSAEAEDLVGVAQATGGEVQRGTAGAMDAMASGGAYLAWHAPGPGSAVDLLVPTPPTPYVAVWFSKVRMPSGAAFDIDLVPAHQAEVRPRWEKGDSGFRSRVLGRASGVCRIDCFGPWPWARKSVYPMRPLRNPSPGRVARVRFTCVTKRGRAYLLAVDQIGMQPCPATPAGWGEIESAPVTRRDLDLGAEPMRYGRRDLYGWGARALEARGPGQATVRLVRVLAGPSAAAVEVRGVHEQGTWTLQVDDGPAMRLEGKPAKRRGKKAAAAPPVQPAVWALRLPRPRVGPVDVRLTVRCESVTGRLLLDAWRLRAQAK